MTQRRNYFIEKKLQSKFTLTLLLLIFLVAVITFCNLFVIGNFVVTHYASIDTAGTVTDFVIDATKVIWPRLLLIIIVNIIIVAIIGIFYSHQFAGPSFKMERTLKGLSDGDLSSKIYLRKSDSLHNVAHAINRLIDMLRDVVRKSRSIVSQLRDELEGIEVEDEEASRKLAAIRSMVDELEDLFAVFRLEPDEEPSQCRSEGSGAENEGAGKDSSGAEASS